MQNLHFYKKWQVFFAEFICALFNKYFFPKNYDYQLYAPI